MSLIGLGAKLEIDDGSSNAYAEVVDLVDLGIPDPEVGVIESKRLNLPGGLIGKLAGLKDGGEFEFMYEYSSARKARLDTLVGDQTRNFKITLPDGWVRVVPGFLKSNKMDKVVPDEIMRVTGVVVVRGAATTTPAA